MWFMYRRSICKNTGGECVCANKWSICKKMVHMAGLRMGSMYACPQRGTCTTSRWAFILKRGRNAVNQIAPNSVAELIQPEIVEVHTKRIFLRLCSYVEVWGRGER